MAFRFALASVLKYRESLEKQAYLALARVLKDLAEVEAQLSRMEQWCAESARRREAETARGIVSVHLQRAYERELELEKQRDDLRVQQQELKIKREQYLKAYDFARQKHEVLKELRSRQLDGYQTEEAKREQNRIDDLFLSRRKTGG